MGSTEQKIYPRKSRAYSNRSYFRSNPVSLEKAKTVKTWTPHLPQSSQSFNAGSVTVPRLKTLILRPPSVSVHFNRYVLRHQLGCSHSGRVYSSAAVNDAISDLVEPVSHSSLLLVGLSSQL
ncbi:unnamed protein product [Brassica napus]|uniref:(rape) hypothetical protein n=1 Tax=Brassica napus TaxID=3708 RepID=A0A816J4C1_BRANA|nr:unnamed protein product [Brassica napus]